MTANQIANASNIEANRHNTAVEDETIRHDTATEDLQKEANRITEDYNQKKLELEEWYNQKYIEYLNSSDEWKEQIQGELAEIERLKAEADKAYKEQMTNINQQMADTDEMYKTAMGIKMSEELNIEYLRAYYENQKTEVWMQDIQKQWDIAQKKLENDIIKIEHDYQLGLISEQTRMHQVQNAINTFQFELTKWQQSGYALTQAQVDLLKEQMNEVLSRTAKNYSDIGSDWVDAFTPF